MPTRYRWTNPTIWPAMPSKSAPRAGRAELWPPCRSGTADRRRRRTEVNDLDLLARIQERRSELVATDSAHFDIAINYYPDLSWRRNCPARWPTPGPSAPRTRPCAHRPTPSSAACRQDGGLARLQDRYFGHIKRINPIGAAQFIEDMRSAAAAVPPPVPEGAGRHRHRLAAAGRAGLPGIEVGSAGHLATPACAA